MSVNGELGYLGCDGAAGLFAKAVRESLSWVTGLKMCLVDRRCGGGRQVEGDGGIDDVYIDEDLVNEEG